MDLAYLGSGRGLQGGLGPVVFLVVLLVTAIVWSGVLFVLARALSRRVERESRA